MPIRKTPVVPNSASVGWVKIQQNRQIIYFALGFQPKLPKGRLKLLFQTASLFSGCLKCGMKNLLLHPRSMVAFAVVADDVVVVGNQIAEASGVGDALLVVVGAVAVIVIRAADIIGRGAVFAVHLPGVNIAFLPFHPTLLDDAVLDVVGIAVFLIGGDYVFAAKARPGHAFACGVDQGVGRNIGGHDFVYGFAARQGQHGGRKQQNGFQAQFW